MTPAFKEWSYIVDALGKGLQKVILRKGGIHEETGEFTLDFSTFVLFPTAFHQAENRIKESWFSQLSDNGIINSNEVLIKYYAEVKEVKMITEWITLTKLDQYHAWKEDVIKEKFQRWNQQVHMLVLQVYELNEPVKVDVIPDYGGCKSWIELEENISLEGAPVEPDPPLLPF